MWRKLASNFGLVALVLSAASIARVISTGGASGTRNWRSQWHTKNLLRKQVSMGLLYKGVI